MFRHLGLVSIYTPQNTAEASLAAARVARNKEGASKDDIDAAAELRKVGCFVFLTHPEAGLVSDARFARPPPVPVRLVVAAFPLALLDLLCLLSQAHLILVAISWVCFVSHCVTYCVLLLAPFGAA